jgi:hypothetical protein
MPDGFRWQGNGSKIECETCLRAGYPHGTWLYDCKRGHPFGCDICGRRFSNKASAAGHRTKAHHPTPLPPGAIAEIEHALGGSIRARLYLAAIFDPTHSPHEKNREAPVRHLSETES